MGKRLFWFAVGVGLAAVVVLKGRELYEKFTPKGVAGQLENARTTASSWLGDFVTTVSEAMAEREGELREATGLDG
jgi:hypothetical protein